MLVSTRFKWILLSLKQSTYQISHVIVPDIVYSNDSHISDEILYKSKENMLGESHHYRKPDVISCGNLVQCEARVLNELEFDYNSDDFISTAVNCYQEVTSNV
ncbi:unnamed protein product [Schistosoma mattheei]|uniref:Uncharacterized protein n=1 Tax=Schistosoma mattheei TaxID=31246 RepID=A0A183NTP4_9TREM|nr:unnamed protein product [Schistosoma mattheei]